jgi:MutS domain V
MTHLLAMKKLSLSLPESTVRCFDCPVALQLDLALIFCIYLRRLNKILGSGKSTYLKQVAIITILAHCGSYVTAEMAKIPIRDRVCCRIGNTDDQEHNISTFLLEMKETAFICNNATDRTLVLVDELGRATSNEDGVAIAWSMSEYLLKKRAMTFFVTHYPQLSSLATIYPSVQNIHLSASVSQESHGEISYTHKAMPGACSVSTDYGVKLSAVCGWPVEVVEDASRLQTIVESLLPEESLCHQRPLQQLSDARTKNYLRLSKICSELQGLMVDGKMHSLESIQSELVSLHERHVADARSDLMKAMDQLLSHDPGVENDNLNLGTDFVDASSGEKQINGSGHKDQLRHVTTEDAISSSCISDAESSVGSNGSWDLSSGSSDNN